MSASTPAPELSSTAARPASKNRPILLAFLLVVVTAAAFYPVWRLPFINYDDNLYVTGNIQVQSGLDWETVRWAFTSFDTANWHPVTWLSHALDCQLFALDPAGPHLVNLLLHTMNVLLLFWVLSQATGFAGRSAVVAALFAVHPINVESVAWIAERKNLLSMLFFLLALGAYGWYVRKPSVGRYSMVAALFTVGLMAKPQIIMLPFVLLLLDYWPLARTADQSTRGSSVKNFSWLVWEKVPLFALSGASAIVTLLAHIRGAVRPLPLSLRLANAIISYVRYVKLALWPSHLAVYYPHQLISLRNWNVVADFLFLALVTWLVMVERRRRYLFVGWFWFFVTLLPMIGIVQVGTQGMANRYGYLSLIGIFIMAGWGAADAFEHLRIPIVLQTGAATIVLAALLITTHRELQYWSDSVTLWTHTLAVTRDNAIAEVDLGAALLQQGEVGRAMEHFRAATMIDPLDPLANMYIGRYAQTQNNPTVAIAAYKKVVQSSKDPGLKARALSNMGNAYRALGDEFDARKCFQAAARLGD